MRTICVIGAGYVGLVTGTCFADLGNHVVCIDVDQAKVEKLSQGLATIFEPGLEELIQRNVRAGRLRFSHSYADGVPEADFIFIAVGTPERADGAADMSQVEAAAAEIGRYLRGHAIIVNKSTVPIGTGDLVAGIVERHLQLGNSFRVVSNPEFLREGAAVTDFLQPDRIVLGATDRQAAEQVATLYEALGAPVIITDLRTAEMIKYASNAVLATRISFINEIAHICEALGADVKMVALGMGYDQRIGHKFLDAGVGYGGSCFPKDVKALAHMAQSNDCHPQLLTAVMDINADSRRRFVEKVEQGLGTLSGARVAVWGLSFKPNTDDMREAPSVDIIQHLQQRGARVHAYDPVANGQAHERLPDINYHPSAYAAAEDADAVVLLTEWNEFKQLDLQRVFASLKRPFFFDGRNLYDPEEMQQIGFVYRGVGRAC